MGGVGLKVLSPYLMPLTIILEVAHDNESSFGRSRTCVLAIRCVAEDSPDGAISQVPRNREPGPESSAG